MIKGALSREKLANGKSANARLALLVDQMEEMYTQEEVGQKDREAFVDVLDALARCGRVWVIGTLRSDFYQAVGKLPKLVALKEGDGQYDLLPPTASEMGQMIRLPTRAAGLRFEEDPSSSERLDDMLRDAAAEHPEVLPLLQFTLEELYQRRTEDGMLTLAAYRELGGVEGSLAQRAETVFKDLPDDVEAELPKVLNALVSIERDGYEQIGRKRALWSEATKGKSREFIEAFVENRLFVTELADDGSAVVTVAHEALLWHWPRVNEWVAQNRENLRIRSRITAATARWVAEDRPSDLLLPSGKPLVEAESLLEQDLQLTDAENGFINASFAKAKRFQRLKRGVVAALAVLSMVAATSAYFATEQRDLANQARARAEVEAETAKRTTEFMVDLFSVSDPSESLGNSITAREILDKGASRIETELADQPETQATLMDTMGTVYTSLGLYDPAASLVDKALQRRRSILGEQHESVARSKSHLGEVLMLKADYEVAEANLREALQTQKALYGESHAEVADTLSKLADVLTRKGNYKVAGELIRQSLEIRRSLHGGAHPDIAESLEDLGLNYFDEGDYERAATELRAAVDMRRELHGDVHPALAEAINNLYWVLRDSGNLEEAEALSREALAMKRTLHGDVHPEIAMGLNNLAYVLEMKGDLPAATANYREALAMMRQVVSGAHPDIALILGNLSFAVYDAGDKREAIALAREALTMYREVLGAEHPRVASNATGLGYWLVQEGEYGEAAQLLDEAVAIRRKALGDSHPQLASSLTAKANLLLATERFSEARDVAKQARGILAENLPEDHWRIAAAATVEGAALTRLGAYAEAESLLLGSIEPLSQAPIPGIAEQNRQRLADMYTAWNRPTEALKYRQVTDYVE